MDIDVSSKFWHVVWGKNVCNNSLCNRETNAVCERFTNFESFTTAKRQVVKDSSYFAKKSISG